MKGKEISEKLEISEDMVNKWLEVLQNKVKFEKMRRYIDSSYRIQMMDKILEIKRR